MRPVFGIVMCLLLLAQIHKIQSEDDIVQCGEQEESCICRPDVQRCFFRLEIEELQTFTSYRLTRNGENLFMRGTAGGVYFLNENGYTPSVNAIRYCPAAPECMNCRIDNVLFGREDRFLTERSCTIPMTVDGTTYRLFIAVNGRIPGPTLIVTEEQEMIVDVYNNLTSEGVSIHWHGVHQRGTPWMDGVASLSHIPIVPRGRFQYKFEASPAGTHWYHSHLGAQRTDGLFGALIIRERATETEYRSKLQSMLGSFNDMPEKHTLTLLDWQRESSLNLFVQIHSTLGFFPNKNVGVVPDNRNDLYFPRSASSDRVEVGPVPYYSGLINGKGRYDPNTYSILSIFEVDQGSQYRFRLVGAQSLYAYRFEIEQHRLWVIATDGKFVKPRPVDYIIIHSGERYDFIVSTSEPVGNYWIKATTLETQDSGREHSAEAILHYSDADNPNPAVRYNNVGASNSRLCSSTSRCIALNCPFLKYPASYNIDCIIIDQLEPLITGTSISNQQILTALQNTDQLKFFNFGFEGRSSTSAINGRNFLPPATPHQTYRGQYDIDKETCKNCIQGAPVEDCVCTYTESIAELTEKTVVMVFSAINEANQSFNFSHPIHLHGHNFSVVYVGHGEYNIDGNLDRPSRDIDCKNDAMCRNPTWRGSQPLNALRQRLTVGLGGGLPEQSILKDTVIVPAGGYVVIAFTADNPGYWFLHCHIEVHQLEGMAVILQEYSEDQHPIPPEGINKVGDFSGNVQDPPDSTRIESSVWRNVGISFIVLFFVVLLIFSLIFAFIVFAGCCRSKPSSEEQVPKTFIQ